MFSNVAKLYYSKRESLALFEISHQYAATTNAIFRVFAKKDSPIFKNFALESFSS